MKKILYMAMAASLLFALMGCGEEDSDSNKEKKPKDPVYYTVTFDKNTTDPDSTDPVPKSMRVQADEDGRARIGELPETKPARKGYIFDSYNFKPDGSGLLAGVGSRITEDTPVYAQWEKVGAVKQDGDTLVHTLPPLEPASGNAAGSVLYDDNSIKLFKGDSFDYKFPDEVFNGGTPLYDFYKVAYEILDKNWNNEGSDQNSATSVFIRQYRTTTLYTGWSNAANLMPWLSNPNNPLILEIKGANNTGGFRIYGNCNGNMTFIIKTITFYKAPRYTVSFDWNYTGSTTIPVVNPVTNVWGPFEGHPGYPLGTQLPAAPDRSAETPAPQYFVGWFDENNTEYIDTSAITKTLTLKGKWSVTPPEQVEKITVNSNSGVPIYRFTLANQWGDPAKGVSKITYTIWVGVDATANRMHIVAPLTGISANGSKIQQSGWGDFRLVNVAGGSNVSAILSKGKNKSGETGSPGEWVTYEYVIGPTNSDVVSPETSGFAATNYPAASATSIYIGLGLSSNANTVVYYIKDVALILADGSKVANDSINSTDAAVSATTKLGAFYFAAGGTHPVVTRIMANSPGD